MKPCRLLSLISPVAALALTGCASLPPLPGSASPAPAVAFVPRAGTFEFEEDALGTSPAGFTIGSTNAGIARGTWEVLQGPDVPSQTHVVAITNPGHTEQGGYNLLWTDQAGFRDGEIQVDVRVRGGSVDQGGGPIWRVQDADNYYICRWNPLERNFRLYVVENGERRMLATAQADLSTDVWRRISVRHAGDEITCTLSGTVTISATDATIPHAGGVGLWTKADAATAFDGLTVTPIGG